MSHFAQQEIADDLKQMAGLCARTGDCDSPTHFLVPRIIPIFQSVINVNLQLTWLQTLREHHHTLIMQPTLSSLQYAGFTSVSQFSFVGGDLLVVTSSGIERGINS